MSKGTKRLVLPVLFTLACSLAGGPAAAAIRVEPRPAGWLSRLVAALPFGPGKYGTRVDPKVQTNRNKAGIQLDPNGGGPAKP